MYEKHSPHFTVETNNAEQLVATAAGNIEKLLAKRSEALKVKKKQLFFFFFCFCFVHVEIQMAAHHIRTSERPPRPRALR